MGKGDRAPTLVLPPLSSSPRSLVMDTASTVHSNGQGGSQDAPCEEVHVIVSDMHLSAGKVLQVRAKRSIRWRVVRAVKKVFTEVDPAPVYEVPNPLEDFVYDDVFAAFVAKVVATYGSAQVLRIKLMGDVFDPLAVTWGGRLSDPPFEAVAAFKMRKIIRGHASYFDALVAFLKAPNARLDVFV